MKKLLFISLLALCTFAATAQDKATTWAEYNFLKARSYGLMPAGYTMGETNINIMIHYDFSGTRQTQILELYRDGATSPCAIVVRLETPDGKIINFPVPDINSDSEIWKAFKDQLSAHSTELNIVNSVAFALAKYAASH